MSAPASPRLIRDRALPLADIATPNRFELEHLTGLPCATLAEAKRAVAALQALMRPDGLRAVLLTSLETDDDAGRKPRPAGCRGRRLPPAAHAAAVAGRQRRGRCHRRAVPVPPPAPPAARATALEMAGSSIHGLLARTAEAGSREMLTVQAQEEFVAPSLMFAAVTC